MIRSFLHGHSRSVARSAALASGTVAGGIGLLATSGYLISKAALQPPVLTLTVAIVGVRFFAISRAVLRYCERLSSHDLTFRLLASIRVRFYERLVPLAPTRLRRFRSADLLSRFVADVDSLQHVYLSVVAPPLVALSTSVLAVTIASLLLPTAGLALGCSLLAAAAILLMTGRVSASSRHGQSRARSELTAELDELVRGAPELALYGHADDRRERFERADRRLMRLARLDAVSAGLTGGLGVLLTALATAAVVAVAIPATAHHQLPGTQLAVLAFVALAAFEAITPLSASVQQLATTKGAKGRLDEATSAAPLGQGRTGLRPVPGGTALEITSGRVRHRIGGPLALDGIDFRLERGQRIAVVGASGSGKTTLAHVLVRFCELADGRATLDGHDLRDYPDADVRRTVLLCAEDAYLFATTVGDNVRVGKQDASDAEVVAALVRVGAGPLLESLPDGLATQVGENGALLSGGQRRRIAVARAVLAGSPFLILDEPTADLDDPSAAALLDDVIAAAPGAGLLVITHRLAGLAGFDEILVLANGRIVERGTERDLLAKRGHYAALREQQPTPALLRAPPRAQRRRG